MKKLLSLVTVLAVILSLCAMPVGAVEEYESDAQGVIYELNGDGTAYTVTGTYDTAADVVIPATFKGLPVTAIGYGAFWGCTEMLTLAFEGNITEVDTYAFRECDNLTSVTVPPSVTKMGLGVFEECTHLDIVFCLLPSQPDGWNEYWKTGCDAEVYWGEGISVDGVYYEANADGTEYTVVDYAGGSQLVIPDTYYGVPVTRIASNALADYDHIETAVIGSNVREIKKRAFAGCTALTRIVIPTAVTSMGSEVFNGCKSLTSILCGHASKPEGWNDDWKGDCSATVRWLGEMDDQGLIYYKLTDGTAYWVSGALDPEADIVIPDTFNGLPVAGIDDYALEYEEGIKTLVIGSNVRTIGMYAFGNCRGLTEITIPANVKNVDEYVFCGCTSLTDIYCEFTAKPSGWSSYWNADCDATVHWLSNCSGSLKLVMLNDGSGYYVDDCDNTEANVAIPDEYYGLPVTSISYAAFSGCNAIETLKIGANVKTIDPYAFNNCSSLKQIRIPETVVYVSDNLFNGCDALTDIWCEVTRRPSTWSSLWLNGCNAYVHWVDVTDEQGLTYRLNYDCTEYYVFDCAKSATHITVPATYDGIPVTIIGVGAFYSCTRLESITFEGEIELIRGQAFESCMKLTQITLPAGLKTISGKAFYNCSNLTQITIPETVTWMDENVFGKCVRLTDIYCQVSSKPANWNDNWNAECDAEVHWLAKDIMLGDIDGDEIVNMRDAMVLYQFVSGNRDGMTDDQKEAADIDKSGVINMLDAMYLYSYVSGLRDSLT